MIPRRRRSRICWRERDGERRAWFDGRDFRDVVAGAARGRAVIEAARRLPPIARTTLDATAIEQCDLHPLQHSLTRFIGSPTGRLRSDLPVSESHDAEDC
jgi:hypothetical protein